MKNIAIIPARGGSKGIPRKNIKLIAGKPLIVWTIESALAATSVDRVIVSTDSDEIALIAREAGAETPFMRPAELSGDAATTESSLIHALEWLKQNEGYTPDAVTLLQCTSPVRGEGVIDLAFDQFLKTAVDSLLSVSPFWHFLWEGVDLPVALYDYRNRPRRQDIPENQVKFKENGSLYISKTSGLLENQNRLFGKIGSFVMEECESFEIDTPLDWVVVESILQHKKALLEKHVN